MLINSKLNFESAYKKRTDYSKRKKYKELYNSPKMFDTTKMLLLPKDLRCTWNITELQQRLDPFTGFHRTGPKPLGFIKNICVTGTNNFLFVEGSLSKYFMGNNVENFDWKFAKPAIKMLSADLGLPLGRAELRRCDIAGNFELEESVIDYFPELNYLRYYERTNKRKTTLRFESNSGNVDVKFYDKLAEYGNKHNTDAEIAALLGTKNLMRYEVQIQKRIAAVLGMRKIKVVHLYSPSFYKRLLNYWYFTYCNIEKKAIMVFPKHIKGRKAVDKFIYRYFVENLGWQNIEAMFDDAQKNGCLTADDKSKKLRQLRSIMEDSRTFLFKEITNELNEKVADMYLDALVQIKRIKQGNYKAI